MVLLFIEKVEKGVGAIAAQEPRLNEDIRIRECRLIGYDGASYKSQLQANAAPIAPVVTIVLYFGEKHWCKERNIKSLMNIPKELDPLSLIHI